MPDVRSTLEFLARLPLYETEKPYLYLPGKDEGLDPNVTKLDNLEFEHHSDILIRDMRQHPELKFDDCGFELHEHPSRYQQFDKASDIESYRAETEKLLKTRFNAEKVMLYDIRLRKNNSFDRTEFDVYDPLVVEGPAKGAHNDVTFQSAPEIVKRYLPQEERNTYLKPGYRIRILNTWRPLNNVLEDRPLAFCDSRSVETNDLMPTDRILPDRIGEVYYLQHNPNQQWYWIDRQRNEEMAIFLAFDSGRTENGARLCPHVSFSNPNAPKDAAKRESIECRAIIITKV